jgi:hypothetical protein
VLSRLRSVSTCREHLWAHKLGLFNRLKRSGGGGGGRGGSGGGGGEGNSSSSTSSSSNIVWVSPAVF